ncbi:MAG: hypothetical protein GC154_05780 [bacterium]|nr:hypothetical protein [bacterium]
MSGDLNFNDTVNFLLGCFRKHAFTLWAALLLFMPHGARAEDEDIVFLADRGFYNEGFTIGGYYDFLDISVYFLSTREFSHVSGVIEHFFDTNDFVIVPESNGVTRLVQVTSLDGFIEFDIDMNQSIQPEKVELFTVKPIQPNAGSLKPILVWKKLEVTDRDGNKLNYSTYVNPTLNYTDAGNGLYVSVENEDPQNPIKKMVVSELYGYPRYYKQELKLIQMGSKPYYFMTSFADEYQSGFNPAPISITVEFQDGSSRIFRNITSKNSIVLDLSQPSSSGSWEVYR